MEAGRLGKLTTFGFIQAHGKCDGNSACSDGSFNVDELIEQPSEELARRLEKCYKNVSQTDCQVGNGEECENGQRMVNEINVAYIISKLTLNSEKVKMVMQGLKLSAALD
jgi:hypothetical protein